MAASEFISIFAVVISAVTFFWGFSKNKKLNAEIEWHKVWASDFLEKANKVNSLTSSIVVSIYFWKDVCQTSKKSEAKKLEEEIRRSVNELRFYEWELQKFSQFAPLNKKKFSEDTQDLFQLLNELLAYCKDPSEDSAFDLEKIREAQFLFSKASRELHKELLGL